MEFFVVFRDGSQQWVPWSPDLFATIAYELYCRSEPMVYHLLFNHQEALARIRDIKRQLITDVKPKDIVYVNLVCYGAAWFETLGLENTARPPFRKYVVVYEYGTLSANKRKIIAYCPVFNESWTVDNWFVKQYGSTFDFNSELMILVDAEFVAAHPEVLRN